MHELSETRENLVLAVSKQLLNEISSNWNFAGRAPNWLNEEIVSLSTAYHSGTATPWATVQSKLAYLLYFYPLNYVRLRTVVREASKLGFWSEKPIEVLDFGSGPGTFAHALQDEGVPVTAVTSWDSDEKAHQIHRELAPAENRNSYVTEAPMMNFDVFTASYSLNELTSPPEKLWQAERILIVEPSTHSASQKLIALREMLLERGYQIWAPCTHAQRCPLQQHPRDWCHTRVPFVEPNWFHYLQVPMRNSTLTYSYLLAHRSLAPPKRVASSVRVIGDTLLEKGRSRQLICSSSDREEMHWYPKRIPNLGKDFEIPRGHLIPRDLAKKELRGASWWIEDPRLLLEAP